MDGDTSTGNSALTRPAAAYRFPRVAAYVRTAISQTLAPPAFTDLLLQIMGRDGRVLAPTGLAKWPAFVIEVCRALGGDPAAAVGAAAAVEFVLAAADIVDDLVDREWDEGFARADRALNATLALGALAHRCIADQLPLLGAHRAPQLHDLVSTGLIRACSGEDLDLLLETDPLPSEEQVREMTARKSGTLVAMACKLGAAIATEDQSILNLVETFGQRIGFVAQLLNDIGGVKPGMPAEASDLRRRKKTLPIAFALRCAQEEGIAGLLRWSESTELVDDSEQEDLTRLIDTLGALHYTWIVADAYRREALDALEELVQVTGRDEVWSLRRLIPSTRARPIEARGMIEP